MKKSVKLVANIAWEFEPVDLDETAERKIDEILGLISKRILSIGEPSWEINVERGAPSDLFDFEDA